MFFYLKPSFPFASRPHGAKQRCAASPCGQSGRVPSPKPKPKPCLWRLFFGCVSFFGCLFLFVSGVSDVCSFFEGTARKTIRNTIRENHRKKDTPYSKERGRFLMPFCLV